MKMCLGCRHYIRTDYCDKLGYKVYIESLCPLTEKQRVESTNKNVFNEMFGGMFQNENKKK